MPKFIIASALNCALSSRVLQNVGTLKKLAGLGAYALVVLVFTLALPYCHSTRNWNKHLEALALQTLLPSEAKTSVTSIRFLTITLECKDAVACALAREALSKGGIPGRFIGSSFEVSTVDKNAPPPPELSLFLAFGASGIRLAGEIPEEAVRVSLLESVKASYSEDRIDERLELKPRIQPLESLPAWCEFIRDLLLNSPSGKLRYEDGKIILSGTCKTAEDHERLLKLTAELGGEVLADDFQPEIIPVPATMTVEHDGAGVTLTGTVPNFEMLEAIDAVARQAVDVDEVLSEVDMPPNVTSPEWFELAVICLGDIMKLLSHRGRVTFSENKVVVEGVTNTLGQRYRLNQYLKSIDADQWEIDSSIEVKPPDFFNYSISKSQEKRFVFGAVDKESTRDKLKKAVESVSPDLHHEVQVAERLRVPSWTSGLSEFVVDLLKSAPDANLSFSPDKIILANVSMKKMESLLNRTLTSMPVASVVLTSGKLNDGSGSSFRNLNAELANHPIGFASGHGKFSAPSQSTEIEALVKILAIHGLPILRMRANLNPDRGATVKLVAVRATTVRDALVASGYPEDRIQILVRKSKDPLEKYNSVSFIAVP